jgi:hypothetical protein
MDSVITDLSTRVDNLLFELCEAGIFELGNDKSPQGSHFDCVAHAADYLNQLIFKDGDIA